MKGRLLLCGAIIAMVTQMSFAQTNQEQDNTLGFSQYMQGLVQTVVVTDAISDYMQTYEQCPKDLDSLGIASLTTIQDSPVQGMQLNKGCELKVTFKKEDFIAPALKAKTLTIKQTYNTENKRIDQQCSFDGDISLGIKSNCRLTDDMARQAAAFERKFAREHQKFTAIYEKEGTLPKLRTPMIAAEQTIEAIAEQLNADYLYKQQCPDVTENQQVKTIVDGQENSYVEDLTIKKSATGCQIIATFKQTAPIPSDLYGKVVYKEMTFMEGSSGYSAIFKSNAPKIYRGAKFHESN